MTSRSKAALLGMGIGGVALIAACAGLCLGVPCFPLGIRYGAWTDTCPVGEPRLGLEVSAYNLVRGQSGYLEIAANLHYLELTRWGDEQPTYAATSRGVDLSVTLLDSEDKPVEGVEITEDGWAYGRHRFALKLPALPDGDYVLLVKGTSNAGESEARAPLKLYAPAVLHVATDLPLYRPGQEVRLRSLSLRRTDLAPLEGRPGRFEVRGPDGTVLLREKRPTGVFGVADTSIPLDPDAPTGTWTARWESGDTSDEVKFDVRPFQLPRLTVEVTPSQTFYGISDRVVLKGRATYASGAPVANAPVSLRVRAGGGRWPMPLDWEAPKTAITDGSGAFTLDLGPVPADLMERATLSVTAEVTEAAGESAVGAGALVLASETLWAEAVTELGDGLVGGVNNRAYIRVRRPAGAALVNTRVVLRSPYDPETPEREAITDADGVLAVQLDPGDPVTVVDPAPPERTRPLVARRPSLSRGEELATGSSLDGDERRALDAIDLTRCQDLVHGSANATIAARVAASGAVRAIADDPDDLLSRCVADAAVRIRFPSGSERTYALSWSIPDSERPRLDVSVEGAIGDTSRLQMAFGQAALRARACLPLERGNDGSEPLLAHYTLVSGASAPELVWEESYGAAGISAAEGACLRSALSSARLGVAAGEPMVGVATFTLDVPRGEVVSGGGATTRTAYELELVADSGERGRLVLPPGEIPHLRLRATPSLAKPGETVEVEVLRGPNNRQSLPEKLWIRDGSVEVAEAKLDKNKATFTLPSDARGFLHVEYSGVRTVIFVQDPIPLQVALATDQPTYAPGAPARLTVTTTQGGKGVPAGVGLWGADSTLSQLAALLGPDELARVTVQAKSDQPAFGAFDPRALALGQIRGENAAKAAVLRISTLPPGAAGDQPIGASASAQPDTSTPLVNSFYRAYERVAAKVRAWEAGAKPDEVMTPERMAALWEAALADLDAEGKPAVDGWGRPLTLQVLPADLLNQLDPRLHVSDATRLPEDMVAWDIFVREGGR